MTGNVCVASWLNGSHLMCPAGTLSAWRSYQCSQYMQGSVDIVTFMHAHILILITAARSSMCDNIRILRRSCSQALLSVTCKVPDPEKWFLGFRQLQTSSTLPAAPVPGALKQAQTKTSTIWLGVVLLVWVSFQCVREFLRYWRLLSRAQCAQASPRLLPATTYECQHKQQILATPRDLSRSEDARRTP